MYRRNVKACILWSEVRVNVLYHIHVSVYITTCVSQGDKYFMGYLKVATQEHNGQYDKTIEISIM